MTEEKQKPKHSIGRPKRVWTPEETADIERLAKLQLHIDTIADCLQIPKNDIIRHFGPNLAKKRAEGRMEIAEAQRSMLKQPVMAIWLGKQHLGQADKQELGGKDGKPLQVQVVDSYKPKT